MYLICLNLESGYMFDKTCLLDYDHMSFGGAPVETGTEEEAEELVLKNEKASSNGKWEITSFLNYYVDHYIRLRPQTFHFLFT